MMRYAFLLLLALTSSAATLAERIDRLIAASPAARAVFFGVEAVDLATGKTVVQRNPRSFFVPASNTKLFTTSMALMRLGAGYTFRTRVVADGAPDAEGRVGRLRLIGGGDPNLSPRTIPYRVGPVTGDPLVSIGELADQIAAKGVKRVEGNIIGDDRWYTWEPYAGGWSVDDPLYDYGTAVSALTVNDNTQFLNIQPGAGEGDMAAIALNPPLEYYHIDNRLVTVAKNGVRQVRYEREPGSKDLKLWGTIPLGNSGQTLALGIDDPAEFAARALRQALENRGIAVTGDAVALHQFPNEVANPAQADPGRAETTQAGPAQAHPGQDGPPPPEPARTDPAQAEPALAAPTRAGGALADPPAAESGVELASHVSAPLLEDLRITDKVSQNLHAEMALRAVGRARRNIGSREAGLEELKAFLAEAGVADDAWRIGDGSGLSRTNLVTPETVVKLLRFMYGSPQRENWISLLPVGGQDGTLRSRLSDPAVGPRVHAKTGTVAHVSALSGYIQRANGHWVAFSILVNNYNGPAGEITGVMDRICALIME